MSNTKKNLSENSKEQLFNRSKERALVCLNKKEYNRAFAHFLIAVTLQPEVEDEFLSLLLYTLGILSNELETHGSYEELFACYDQALEILPNNSQILHGLATVLFRLGHIKTATAYFRRAYRENPYFTPSLYCMDNIKSSLVERWHFMMLNDKKRNMTFADAIRKAVGDGCKTVLDIGAGTGILSLIAVDAGAEKVYACEGSDVMAQILNSVVETNKKGITVLAKFSNDINIPEDIPEKVDLIVTEIFDAGVFGEHVLKTLSHALDKLLRWRPSMENLSINDAIKIENAEMDVDNKSNSRNVGKVLPSSVSLWAVPIECEDIRQYSRLSPEALELFGMKSVSISTSFPVSEPYTTEKLSKLQSGYKLLSSPKQLMKVDFNDLEELNSLLSGKLFEMQFECSTSGEIDALAVWFDLHLYEDITLSTEPGSDSCWEQAIFPVSCRHLLKKSNHVTSGETIVVTFECKGHLNLKQVSTASEGDELADSTTLSSEVISRMNLMCANGSIATNFHSKLQKRDSNVLDISDVPLMGLKCLLDGAAKLTVLPSKHLMDMNTIMNFSKIGREKLRVRSYEEFCSEPFDCDLLVTEPVELCGLLKKNLFEDIALLRSLQEKPFHILPQKLGIYAVLVDSPDLHGQSKVLSDGHCLDYKISEFMNVYKCNIHQDLQISTISHEKLCNPVNLTSINLHQLVFEPNKLQSFVEFSGSIKVPVTKSGTVTAIPYWFCLDYDDNFVIDTSVPQTQWRQAAILLDDNLDVVEGESVLLEWTCRNSCLNISVVKC